MQNANQKLSESKRKQLTKKLSSRFCHQNLIHQEFYLKSMSPCLKFPLPLLLDDPLLKSIGPQQALSIIKDIPYFKVDESQRYVRIQYENADRVLIVTGVKKDIFKEWIQAWSRDRKEPVVRDLGVWVFVGFVSGEQAMLAKKFFRIKKMERDQIQGLRDKKEGDTSYKHSGKRVRIVRLDQQFFSIIFDILNQTATKHFDQSIQNQAQPSQSPQSAQSPQSTQLAQLGPSYTYIPVYPLSYLKSQQKNQEYEDVYSSQFQSQTSSAYDPNLRIQDIDVQMESQGTQMDDGVGVGTGQSMIVKGQMKEETNYSKTACEFFDRNYQLSQQQSIEPHKQTITLQQSKLQSQTQLQSPKLQQSQPKIPSQQNVQKQEKSTQQAKVEPQQNIPKQQKHEQNNQNLQSEFSQTSHHIPKLPNPPEHQPQPQPQPQPQQILIQSYIFTRYQYTELKKKLTEYRKKKYYDGEGLAKPDIPKFIRRETQREVYKHKFHEEAIKKAKKMRIGRAGVHHHQDDDDEDVGYR